MDQKIVSYSFVGIWEKPLLNIPLLDNRFCKDLFDDPYNTNTGMSPEGFVINYQARTNPSPTVLIGNRRIMVLSNDLVQVLDIFEKVKSELNRVTNGSFPMKLRSYGLNTEYEFVGLEKSSSQWMSERFILKGLAIKEKHKKYKIRTTDINFQILLNDNQKLVILIQPRTNIPKGVFISINHHKDEVLETLPNREELNKLFKDSIDMLEKNIFELILN